MWASRQDLVHQHATLVAGWALPQRSADEFLIALTIILSRFEVRWFWRRHVQKLSTVLQFLFSVSVGQETVVTDTLKALRKYMQKEAADALFGFHTHRLLFRLITIILVTQFHLFLPP